VFLLHDIDKKSRRKLRCQLRSHILCCRHHVCVYLFVCGLFCGVFSVTKDIVSNGRVISEWRIGKDFERSGSALILRYYPGIRLEILRKTMKNLSQDSRSPSRNFNPGPPEYEGVLSTRPRRSVPLVCRSRQLLIRFVNVVLVSLRLCFFSERLLLQNSCSQTQIVFRTMVWLWT
jgi:hypothetical protein